MVAVGASRQRKCASHLVEFAQEGVETFTRAQNKFLEVVVQEAEKVYSGKKEHEGKTVEKAETGTSCAQSRRRLYRGSEALARCPGSANECQSRCDHPSRGDDLTIPPGSRRERNPQGCAELRECGNIADRVTYQAEESH